MSKTNKIKVYESELSTILFDILKAINEAEKKLITLSKKLDDRQEDQDDVITNQQELLEDVQLFKTDLLGWEYFLQEVKEK